MKIITTQKSRMGGQVSHVVLSTGEDAFAKLGRGFERLELLREHRNLISLKDILPVPQVLDFQDNGRDAYIVLQKLPGVSLHKVSEELGRKKILAIISDIFSALWNEQSMARANLLNGAQEELKDIRALLQKGLINKQGFENEVGGKSPEAIYGELSPEILSHDKNVISHGDFCLPNILIDENEAWSLIDLGKAGKGDCCRDLASIEGSLERNIDKYAFRELLDIMHINLSNRAEQKIRLYKTLDSYWYNACL
jgi:aminoglycoside phosphotransferase